MRKYTMTQRTGEELFRVTITADLNDGDYLTDVTEYPKDKFEEEILDELIELKKIQWESHALDDYETLYVNIPFDGQSGQSCHTLETLEVEYINSNGVIFDVELMGDED